jgi:hybrid cluster-associated redox disulfide protein
MSHHENKVTKEMTIADVLGRNPKTAQVFMRYGMHCLGCATATGETITQAAVVHGIELDVLLTELNEA